MKKKITKVAKFKDFKTTRATSSALEKILYKHLRGDDEKIREFFFSHIE